MSKLEAINKLFNDCKLLSLDEKYYDHIDMLYEMFINNIIPSNFPDIIYAQIAKYYLINCDYDNMIKYCVLAIEKNKDTSAMLCLCKYYSDVGNVDMTLYYCIMSLEHDEFNCCFYMLLFDMNNNIIIRCDDTIHHGIYNVAYFMAYYYAYTENNIDIAIKYCLIGIEHGTQRCRIKCCIILGDVYNLNKQYDMAVKYLLMAIDDGSIDARRRIISVYMNMDDITNATKYMGLYYLNEHKHIEGLENNINQLYKAKRNDELNIIFDWWIDKNIDIKECYIFQLYKQLKETRQKLLEAELAPHGRLYLEAKQDFETSGKLLK